MRSESSPASSVTSRSPRTRCRTPSRPRSSAGRATAMPRSPGAWIVATARNGAIDRIRREQHLRAQGRAARAPRGRPRRRGRGRELDPRRAARAPLHVLSPGARRRRADRADAPRGGRTADAGDRPRVPRHGAGARAAARSREAPAPRDGDPVPRPTRPPAPGSPPRRAPRPLPRLQRGLCGHRGRRRSSAASSARRRSASRSSSAC